MLPSRIGHYEITGVLGSGGMSIVYRAIQPSLNRVVALKVLAPTLEHDPVAVERFKQEATSAARLKHPNIVTIYEANVSAPPYYIAMEFLDGGSLSDRLARGALPLADAIRIGGQIALGLDHAHRRGVVHRDVKPSNVIFDSDGKTAVTDFGISRVLDQTQFTVPGAKLGTPDYMSPEQAKGHDADHRSDLYSLAVVLYEMLTGRTPFRNPEPLVTMRQIVEDPVPPPRATNPSLPSGVDGVLLKALAKDPQQRYHSGAAFWRDLITACQGAAVRPGARPRRRALVTVLIAVTIGLATLIAVLLSLGRGQIWVGVPAGGGVERRAVPQRARGGKPPRPMSGDEDTSTSPDGEPLASQERSVSGDQPSTLKGNAPISAPAGQPESPRGKAAGQAAGAAAVGLSKDGQVRQTESKVSANGNPRTRHRSAGRGGRQAPGQAAADRAAGRSPGSSWEQP